ncbi:MULTISPECIES: DUF2802 domain-containing protein [Photobacterium]|uniref:DUF2802 domain-containing protein n=1 Tax=Photobacterium piscicola TaxID=1378299 RepID=A0A1T5HZ77_9GAMM|nr:MULTISPECIES: DUF2802 domain-containing protein [Photobacterium]MEC6821960.1 DUF2802 domain-containing protein [Photobacterium piscicola]MEC6897645.1 DUF2802 domain-containing protein [Photobacterium piscicola]MEC6906178.1 DUF2802 domain-containing protein [Photobacterium piscicola]PST94755.1 DUF2802 domain-containing protein [Photobacterium sp. NCIMB 13483]SKC32148.1 hypothetical protein CZ809_01662 [Photobacterium piscicola]
MDIILQQWLPVAISVVIAITAAVLINRERQARKALEVKFSAIEKVLKNSRLQHESLTKQFNELRTGSIGMSNKLVDMIEQLERVEERQNEIAMNDSGGRLYSRASKMVELGADVNELMKECDLPKAEAELMLSLQKSMPQHYRR